MNGIRLIATLALVALPATACRESRSQASYAGVVDSVVPREVALERFRHGLTPVDSLSGGAPSREALVQAFARAVERRDSAALRRLALSREEFAFLVYPTSPQGLPPYELSPSLMWFMLEGNSRQGLSSLLEAHGGTTLRVTGHECDQNVSREGDDTLWGPCEVRYRGRSGPVSERLFGPIIERDGRFKFVSYANKLS